MHGLHAKQGRSPSKLLNILIKCFGVLTAILFFNSCAHNSSASGDSYSEMIDQDWLFKLSTLRVRDETILKTQDRLPLNFSDLEELFRKELEATDIQYLSENLGVSPALTAHELTQLQSLGAPTTLLKRLGMTPTKTSIPTSPLMVREKTIPAKSNTTSKKTLTTSSNEKPPSEKKKAISSGPTIPPIYTQPYPSSPDPMSRR
jgi:hypothetical protein